MTDSGNRTKQGESLLSAEDRFKRASSLRCEIGVICDDPSCHYCGLYRALIPGHGTTRAFGRGCRCEECKAAQNTYLRRWRKMKARV